MLCVLFGDLPRFMREVRCWPLLGYKARQVEVLAPEAGGGNAEATEGITSGTDLLYNESPFLARAGLTKRL